MAARDGTYSLKPEDQIRLGIRRKAPEPTGPAMVGGGVTRPVPEFVAPGSSPTYAPGFLRRDQSTFRDPIARAPSAPPLSPAAAPDRIMQANNDPAGAAPALGGVTSGSTTTDPIRFPGVGVIPTRIAGISEVTGNPDRSRTFTNMPNETAAALASRGTLQRPGAMAAEGAAYLKTVPELGSGPTLTRPAAGGPATGGVGPVMAARFAASDARSAALEVPGSVAGDAARAARMARDYAGPQTPTQQEGSQRAYEQRIAAILAPGQMLANGAAEQQRTAAQEAGATDRAFINADAGIAQAQITRPRAQSQQVTLDDGTLAQVGENGISRPVTDSSGKPVRTLQAKDDAGTKRTQQLQDALAKSAEELIKASVLPGQPVTPELIATARRQAAQANGHTIAENPETGESLVNINGEWIPL